MNRLSVCFIVRNEQANLPRALDSVRGIADEMLVVDTGSTDDTIRLAQERGARVIHYTWHDDHSAARNFGWEHAIGEWMLWLDGDEALVEESIPELKRRIADPQVQGWMLQRRELTDQADLSRFSEMQMLRLVRKDLPARFVGRYHTQVLPPAPDRTGRMPWVCGMSTIKLWHYGRFTMSSADRSRKAARIMEMELADDPSNIYLLTELGNVYMSLDDPRGKALIRDAIGQLRPTDAFAPSTIAVYLLEHLLAAPAEAQSIGYGFSLIRTLAGRWFPQNVPLKWSIAQRLFQQNEFAGAAAELSDMLRLIETDTQDKLAPFDPRAADDAAMNLGVCLVRVGDLDGAEASFRKLIDNPRRAADAKANLAAVKQLRAMR